MLIPSRMLLLLWIFAVTLATSTYGQSPSHQSRIVGYLPEYRVATIDPAIGKHLTDVVFFSLDPQPGKALQHPRWEAAKPLLMKWKKDHGVRVTITLGGWNRSSGFPKIAATSTSRVAFAEEVLKLCQTYELDGIDLDWEHPKDAQEEADYAALIVDLKRVLQPYKRTVTAAVASWQNMPKAGWEALDAIHLMAYDEPKEHSTFETAVNGVQRLRNQGVPADRIRLGIPFYGRGITARDKTLTYAEIIKTHAPAADINEVDRVYFNGLDLIRRKVQFARDNKLNGVMIWEIGQDAIGEAGLLRVIDAAARPNR